MKSLRLWFVVAILISFEMGALFENEMDKIYASKFDMDALREVQQRGGTAPPRIDASVDTDFLLDEADLEGTCCAPPPGWSRPHPSDTMEDILKRQAFIQEGFKKSKKKFDKRMKSNELLNLVRRKVTPESIEKLLGQNADINVRDAEQKTPLHWAASEAHSEVVQTLIHNGADIHAQDYTGATPLHAVVKYATPRLNERREIIGILIDEGASIYARDYQGRTVLDTTANHELQKFVRYRSLKVYE